MTIDMITNITTQCTRILYANIYDHLPVFTLIKGMLPIISGLLLHLFNHNCTFSRHFLVTTGLGTLSKHASWDTAQYLRVLLNCVKCCCNNLLCKCFLNLVSFPQSEPGQSIRGFEELSHSGSCSTRLFLWGFFFYGLSANLLTSFPWMPEISSPIPDWYLMVFSFL